MNDSMLYIKNPDVIVKEVDEDGALVFNPDTDQILVLNYTSFFIWQQCDGEKEMPVIVDAVQNHFDDIPENEVVTQVEEYMSMMLSNGFIGIVTK